MIVSYVPPKNWKLTEEQKRELEEAKNAPITYDEDCPELSPAMMKAFQCAADQRNRLLSKKDRQG